MLILFAGFVVFSLVLTGFRYLLYGQEALEKDPEQVDSAYLPSSSLSSQEAKPGSSSYKAGYEYGFAIGQFRHDNDESGLDRQRLELISRHNAQGYAKDGGGRSYTDYKKGFLYGYKDGFSGLAQGGAQQKPLPKLPIKISRPPRVLVKKLGLLDLNSDSPSLYDVLRNLVEKNSSKDLFIVSVSHRVNDNTTYHKKFLYDVRERVFLKLERTSMLNEDTYDWVIFFDIQAAQLREDVLWGSGSLLRYRRSKYGKAFASVPLIYRGKASLVAWP